MTKKIENFKLTISISPKSDKLLRQQALNERITLGEMIEFYQNAYLRELEHKKLIKKTADNICQCLVCKKNDI